MNRLMAYYVRKQSNGALPSSVYINDKHLLALSPYISASTGHGLRLLGMEVRTHALLQASRQA